MFSSIKSKAVAVGSVVTALGLLASTTIIHAVDTPIDAAAVTTLGGDMLTALQNAAYPVLVTTVGIAGALFGLNLIIKLVKRYARP